MNAKRMLIIAIAMVLAVLSGLGISAQDKYTLQLPNGVPFSDFRGYEDWQLVSIAQTEDRLKVILANPTMIDAYKTGVPGNGKKFPDGSKIAKIQWKPKKSTEAPFSVNVPTPSRTSSSSRRMARDFRTAADGDTPSLTMTRRPTRSRPIRPAPPIVVTRAIRRCRQEITFSTRTRSGERTPPMRVDIVPGAVLADYELSDHRGTHRKLSELQGGDPLVLVLSRGGFCPKDRRQHEGLLQLHREMQVGYCRLVTISTTTCSRRMSSALESAPTGRFSRTPGASCRRISTSRNTRTRTTIR